MRQALPRIPMALEGNKQKEEGSQQHYHQTPHWSHGGNPNRDMATTETTSLGAFPASCFTCLTHSPCGRHWGWARSTDEANEGLSSSPSGCTAMKSCGYPTCLCICLANECQQQKRLKIKAPTDYSSSSPWGGRQNENKWSHHFLLYTIMYFESIWKISCQIGSSCFICFYAFIRFISAGPYATKSRGTVVI